MSTHISFDRNGLGMAIAMVAGLALRLRLGDGRQKQWRWRVTPWLKHLNAAAGAAGLASTSYR